MRRRKLGRRLLGCRLARKAPPIHDQRRRPEAMATSRTYGEQVGRADQEAERSLP